ncbi:hypothetical protein AVJ23_11145 [Pseudoponticoccus marisrubri]|uniref:Uncharacterized protein n=1 Tax=Pseudoponticoccus marisrubri TaxID=1685382 RepID=A0A0W7WIY4_9RHOB|nr:hypothetical protein AVJ23_11145 [Pseudoponticoccus marisrubri]
MNFSKFITFSFRSSAPLSCPRLLVQHATPRGLAIKMAARPARFKTRALQIRNMHLHRILSPGCKGPARMEGQAMYVRKIEIAGFEGGARAGAVTLVAGRLRVQIPLTLPRQVEIVETRHRLMVLAQALRQARRVPDLGGGGRLRFAPGVLPAELRKPPPRRAPPVTSARP